MEEHNDSDEPTDEFGTSSISSSEGSKASFYFDNEFFFDMWQPTQDLEEIEMHSVIQFEDKDGEALISSNASHTSTIEEEESAVIRFKEEKNKGLDRNHKMLNGEFKAYVTEPSQGDRRTWAKRRKSVSVQRFKPDSSISDPSHAANSIPVNGSYDSAEQLMASNIDPYPKIKFDIIKRYNYPNSQANRIFNI